MPDVQPQSFRWPGMGMGLIRVALMLTLLLVSGWAVPTANPAPASASGPRADLLGVSGNAFPWEDHWGSFQGLLNGSGAGWARVELRWNQVEPSRGAWDWSGTDWLVDSYASHGFQQLGLLGYSVGWASGRGGSGEVLGPPSDLDAWETYVRNTVARYKDRIHAWEIWNEPDVAMFWNGRDGGDPGAYTELLRRAHRAIKSVDPGATVMNGGLTGTERGARFLNGVLDHGGGAYLDAVAFHGYVPTGSIDDPFFRDNVWPLVRQARERSGKPMWITEFGWSSGSSGGSTAGSEAAQANLIARHLPMLFDLGGVERVFVFQFKDPNNQPNYFGITRSNASAKPAYNVVATYGARLAGLGFQRRVDVGIDGVWVMRFTGSGRTVDVVWSQRGHRDVYLPVSSGAVRVGRLDGQIEHRAASGGGITVSVGSEPLFVERDGQAAWSGGGDRCRYFGETNQALCGSFLDYWERYGGLAIFGFPISAEINENGLTTQYLERSKFEYHPEWAGTEWAVVGELLGRTVTQGRQHEPPFQPLAGISNDANCQAFQETGHRLCFGFRDYWRDHGGLWMFGFPITEEFPEVNPDTGQVYTVQYFERARFEYHPEHAGTPYAILLGRLGAQVMDARY